MSQFDAILIPGGGVRAGGKLPPWVRNRLDRVLERHRGEYLMALSAGTPHRPPPLDGDGFPIFESTAAARYLLEQGVSPDRILTETCSYDTIGNAYFAKTIHADPLGLKKLLIVTSAFHLPRVEAVFRWVFGLEGSLHSYQLDFEAVPDEGLPAEALAARQEKERRSLTQLQPTIEKINTVLVFHHWLFAEHKAYAAASPPNRNSSSAAINSY